MNIGFQRYVYRNDNKLPFGAWVNNHRLWQLSTKGPLAFPVFVFPRLYQTRQKKSHDVEKHKA